MQKTPHINRKELKAPDTFVQKGNRFIEFFVQRRSPFILVSSLGAATIILFYGFDYWTSKRLNDAWNALHKAEKVEETKRWDEYKKVHEGFSGARPGFIAATRLGDHHFELARKEFFRDKAKAKVSSGEAVDWYGKARKFSDLLPTEKQLLGIDYGEALELGDQLDNAINEYRVASELPGDAKPYALLKLAGALETKGDAAKAQETYQKLTVDFPSTEFAKMAKNGLRRMKSPNFASKS
ncbi:MAG: hypothetical protein HYR96_00995 [Deltaproteobacteria bacterium]|nr:hypothetical protein [Deltaproteobacteria bacterium]MBI3293420.1 hypothetical protein [Deltaproteobacteria bacterium]